MYTQTLSHTHLQRLINIASPFSPSNNKFTTNLLKQDESESIILPPKHPQILTGNSQSVPVFFFVVVASILRSFVHSRIHGSGCGVLRICPRGLCRMRLLEVLINKFRNYSILFAFRTQGISMEIRENNAQLDDAHRICSFAQDRNCGDMS